MIQEQEKGTRKRETKMSSNSDSDDHMKVYKLRSRRGFPIWKQKIMSVASAKGFDHYLTTNVAVKTQGDIDTKEIEVINETDDDARRVKKGELTKWKRERKRSLAAAEMLTSSVRSKDLKTLAKCKLNPKLMFDVLCKKYGSEEDEDLTDLLDDFKECKLRTKKTDPEDWYAELDQLNEQLEEIDTDFAKSDKEIAAHILANLPKGYSTVKKFIKMGEKYLDDVDMIKKQVSKHWKANFRKKAKTSSSDESSSDSDSDESSKRSRKKRSKKDQFALQVVETKQDTRNQYGVLICGHCSKPGHGIANCWEVHGRPDNPYNNRNNNNRNNNGNNNNGGRVPRKCWNCGSPDHIASNCPNTNDGKNKDDEDDALNHLFVGTMWLTQDENFESCEHLWCKQCETDTKRDKNAEATLKRMLRLVTDSNDERDETTETKPSEHNTKEESSVDTETEKMTNGNNTDEVMVIGAEAKTNTKPKTSKQNQEEAKIYKVCTISDDENKQQEVNDDQNWEIWLADTGASCHVTNYDGGMINESESKNDKIVVGDQRRCEVTKRGDLNLETRTGKECVTLESVRVVNEIGKNIISISKLLKDGGIMEGSGSTIEVKINGVNLIFKKDKQDGLYYALLRRMKSSNTEYCHGVEAENDEWQIVTPTEKKRWPKLTREEAHEKWGHGHKEQLDKMGNFFHYNLTGKLHSCAGCALVKSRVMKTTRTCNQKATMNGERLFVDTTGPYPKSRGGKKYWLCGLDDKSDKTWVYFSPTKNRMVTFVEELVTTINGLGMRVKYLRCDNAGEHLQELIDYCREAGIILEYTAPNTPKQNGRVEKKIRIIWQRAMTMMNHANLTLESQKEFWAEAVACSAFIEDLMIKAGRTSPALYNWTNTTVTKWVKNLVQFGRIGVVKKKGKQAKMVDKGYPAMMVGYALNHGAGTYRLYNPKTKRIIMSRDVKWMDFKSKRIESEFQLFEPGIKSVSSDENESEGESEDDSTISSNDSEKKQKGQENSSDESKTPPKVKVKIEQLSSSNDSSSSSSSSKANSSDDSSSEDDDSSDSSTTRALSAARSKISQISSPRALRIRRSTPPRATTTTPSITTTRRRTNKTAHTMKTRSKAGSIADSVKIRRRNKVVTGDTVPKRIFTRQDEGEDKEPSKVHLVSENSIPPTNPHYIFELKEDTINRLYKHIQTDEDEIQHIFTIETLADEFTPTTIKQALSCTDKELWKKSAIAEVNNFLKRKSWNFIPKETARKLGRKLIGVKWVFKIKHEPDYSLRYKSRVVSKGYMQIPGVDYNEKFSPVAQPSSVKVVLALVLFLFWECELVDIEAAFLEGRLKTKTYLQMPPGLVELGFMTKEEFDSNCIELQGGMYGNVDAALLYFIRFKEFATNKTGLGIEQSKSDPCLFFKKNELGRTIGIIVVYVDDCMIAGERAFIDEMKLKLKNEFGVVEDGRLRKLLGVRYEWKDIEDSKKARVIMNMEDKAAEIISSYEKATGLTPRIQKTPGKPGEILTKNEGTAVKHEEYRSILGKLMFYVTKISPECSYACGQLARQMHNPNDSHWEAMSRIVGYLRGKKAHELVIRRPKSLRIISFGDASYADCHDTRRSSTGDLHTIGGSLVSWRAQKTKFVCLSSAEAEYVALTEMCKEQKFLTMLLNEIHECDLPSILYEDNEAAVYLAKNQHVSARTKHIDIREHYVREHIQELGTIVKIKSEDNYADILTKNVTVHNFEYLGTAILNGFEGQVHEEKFETKNL